MEKPPSDHFSYISGNPLQSNDLKNENKKYDSNVKSLNTIKEICSCLVHSYCKILFYCNCFHVYTRFHSVYIQTNTSIAYSMRSHRTLFSQKTLSEQCIILWLIVNTCHQLSSLQQEMTSQQAWLTSEGYSDSHVWDRSSFTTSSDGYAL